MLKIWGDNYKFTTWRKLWFELAKAQSELGLNITKEQLQELQENIIVTDEDVSRAAYYEDKTKHDVFAHIKTYGDAAPSAKGIIHLGATSQFVVDNTDIIRSKESLALIIKKLMEAIFAGAGFADTHKHVATVGLTHGQPAQPTTVGRRAASWVYDLVIALEHVEHSFRNMRFRGARGATGTEASFMILFEEDSDKVELLNHKLCEAFGFDPGMLHILTGQVYPRICDSILISALSNLAAVCQKIATDIRLLAARKELLESFDKDQVGSSAMPYKKNPIKCEKICGLSRFVMGLSGTALSTTSEQWLERSLDDSSTRRLVIPEAFLAIDGVLGFLKEVFSTLTVNREEIKKNMDEHLPYAMTEDIMLIAAKNGADRQEVHELLREHCVAGDLEDLQKVMAEEELFTGISSNIPLDPTGRACDQVEHFTKEVIMPLKAWYKELYH